MMSHSLGASALVDFIVRCIFLCLVFCPRRLVVFLSTFHFSTEDGFPHVLEPSWRAIPFHWSRSTPHYPVSMRANHPFALFSSLFAQTLPQENCRPLLLTPEPSRASTCTGEEGGRRYTADSPCICTADSRNCRARGSLHVGDRYPIASRRSWCSTSAQISVPSPLLLFPFPCLKWLYTLLMIVQLLSTSVHVVDLW
jgi:hypothetical protein